MAVICTVALLTRPSHGVEHLRFSQADSEYAANHFTVRTADYQHKATSANAAAGIRAGFVVSSCFRYITIESRDSACRRDCSVVLHTPGWLESRWRGLEEVPEVQSIALTSLVKGQGYILNISCTNQLCHADTPELEFRTDDRQDEALEEEHSLGKITITLNSTMEDRNSRKELVNTNADFHALTCFAVIGLTVVLELVGQAALFIVERTLDTTS